MSAVTEVSEVGQERAAVVDRGTSTTLLKPIKHALVVESMVVYFSAATFVVSWHRALMKLVMA